MPIHKLIKILQTFLGEPHSKQLQAFSVSVFLAVTHFFFQKKRDGLYLSSVALELWPCLEVRFEPWNEASEPLICWHEGHNVSSPHGKLQCAFSFSFSFLVKAGRRTLIH